MLVWVEGGLNPNEIKKRALSTDESDVEFGKRLLAFLDDTISNSIPEDPEPSLTVPSDKHHPCSVRGMPTESDDESFSAERQKDLRNVVLQCQSHSHFKTCFKYWHGPPEQKTCRFDLHEDNFRAISCFDPETGEIQLRCLNGLVNNFNATMIEALRNNMDIKFIGSGASAKGILYYITDYITKSQLKTHVAFAMLGLAVKKLGKYNPLAAWDPRVPALLERRYSPATPKRGRDDAADAAFDSFGSKSSPSPAKKQRHATGK
jgi:hypothetical protein